MARAASARSLRRRAGSGCRYRTVRRTSLPLCQPHRRTPRDREHSRAGDGSNSRPAAGLRHVRPNRRAGPFRPVRRPDGPIAVHDSISDGLASAHTRTRMRRYAGHGHFFDFFGAQVPARRRSRTPGRPVPRRGRPGGGQGKRRSPLPRGVRIVAASGPVRPARRSAVRATWHGAVQLGPTRGRCA